MGRDSAELRFVDDDAGLRDLVRDLRDEPRVAVDTESDSMHAYFEKVCVVQVSAPGRDYVIDALVVDLAPFGEMLADPRIEKVFHAADYDILCLKRAFGFELRRLFDTMIAARVLGWEQCGLAALLQEHFSHAADKRFQRYDWARRPLDEAALAYARFDTHFLLALRELQLDALAENGRLEIFQHACERQTRVQPRPRTFDATAFWKIKGARELDAPGRSVLQALYVLRDDLARASDRAPFRVMGDAVLVDLARRRPTTGRALKAVRGLSPGLVRRHGARLLEAVREAQERPPPAPPPRPARPSAALRARHDAARAWRKQVAAAENLDPDLVLPRSVLQAVAEAGPQDLAGLRALDLLDAWELERYGQALVDAMRTAVSRG